MEKRIIHKASDIRITEKALWQSCGTKNTAMLEDRLIHQCTDIDALREQLQGYYDDKELVYLQEKQHGTAK